MIDPNEHDRFVLRFDSRATCDVTTPIPYDFTFSRDGHELGVHRRRIGSFRDVYDIDMSGDRERTLDRRLVLAAAVGMDALQAR